MSREELIADYVRKYRGVGNIEDRDNDIYECCLLEEMEHLGIYEEVFDELEKFYY